MPEPRPILFTPRFFLMCSFTFTVFISAFQLLPTAPYRILALGGTQLQAGMFLGLLTYASAFSAPFTGGLADRVGKRRMLVSCSLALTVFAGAYAFVEDVRVMLALVFLHGLFWSGLLSASSAYITDFIPASRRAEGISYWGLSSLFAIAVAPAVGLRVFQHGWGWLCLMTAALNLGMALIAWTLEPDQAHPPRPVVLRELVEWRVLSISITLFLYSFGYGGITSFVALYADANRVTPNWIFFSVFAAVTVVTRPFAGRFADRLGHKKVFVPCLVLIVAGLALLTRGGTRTGMVAAALVFGCGFGAAYPAFAAYVLQHVDPARRGAAFGSILAAFDTGIGTGSMATGWLVQRFGFPRAFAAAALLSALALPYFLVADRRFLEGETPPAA
jgi:MFS family permease